MARSLILLALALLNAANGLCAGLPAPLADPTRPPPGFGGAGEAAIPEAPLVVSSLFLMGARPYAVVDGETVRVGDKLGDGRVSRINEQGVWIVIPGAGKAAQREKQLKWLSAVRKTPVGQFSGKMEK